MNNTFYITTTLPYVNAKPHIGFAAEIIRADVIARYQRLLGKEVFFNTGTDEHGLKIFRKAQESGIDPQIYTDEYAAKFNRLKQALNLSYNSFIRTTDPHHIQAAQEFWKGCEANGDIYKKLYNIKYCVGCELEKTESELVDNHCPIHPNLELEIIEEENYFFRWSKYQNVLLKLYKDNPSFVIPTHRLKEIENFVAKGLEDFSISRLKSKMPWGIEVPGDPEHVMYVWFDALINYISCLGWPEDTHNFTKYWPGMQVAGKDNLRQQSAMWQAMLLSAGLPTSSQILIFGFITSGGQKMSKSLGNVIDPYELVEKYGTDAVRYFLLKEISPFEDSDFTTAHFEEIYNSDLANGLGNLVQRVITLAVKFTDSKVPRLEGKPEDLPLQSGIEVKIWRDYDTLMQNYRFKDVCAGIWRFISAADEYVNTNKPWELAKTGDIQKLNLVIYDLLESIHQIGWMIYPFMPKTAQEIGNRLGVKAFHDLNSTIKASWESLASDTPIETGEGLFPRI